MSGFPVILILAKVDNTGYDMNYYFSILLDVVIYFALLVYILVRGYLVVEYFINLLYLPVRIYDVP